jgi:hypothetical protein
VGDDGSLTTDSRLESTALTLLDDLFHHAAARASNDRAAAV